MNLNDKKQVKLLLDVDLYHCITERLHKYGIKNIQQYIYFILQNEYYKINEKGVNRDGNDGNDGND